MNLDDFKMAGLGALFGTAVTMACFSLPPSSYYKIYKKAKRECEKELPRHEECVIRMVPKSQQA